MENNSFIPPDYSGAVERDISVDATFEEDDDDFVYEDITEEDVDNDIEDYEVSEVKHEENKVMSTPISSTPFTPTSASSSSPFGNPGWGASNPSPWSSPIPNSSFGTPQSRPAWGNSSVGNTIQIDRTKKTIFCDFIDGVVEAYTANGKPGLRPRDVYDLRPRFEVWEKLAAFNPERIFLVIPASLVPESANGVNAWNVALSYFCCCLSSYLRIPYENCQIIRQSFVGQPKAEAFNAILSNPNLGIDPKESIVVGVYSGSSGLSNIDKSAAEVCGMDYVDIQMLLNSLT